MTKHKYLPLLALSAALSGCDSRPPSSSSPSSDVTANEAADTPPVLFKKAGQAAGVALTVESVQQQSRIGPEGLGPSAGPGETLVVVRYSIKNTADKPLGTTDRPGVTLIDGGGQSYSDDSQASVLASSLNNDIQDALSDINPNVTAHVTAVWKVDKKAFSRATWKLVAATDPQLTFALK